MTHVSVAIVGFRNVEDVQRCIAAVSNSTHADFDVVICENGGHDAFKALAAALPGRLTGGQPIELIEAPGNLGFAGGVNLCIAAAPRADAVWVLNPDTEAEPGALAALVARLAVGDRDAVGGILARADGSVQGLGGRWRRWLARPESIGMGRRVDAAVDVAATEASTDFILGASLLASRRFLNVVGPMREDYFLYVEEVEWCLRGVALGLKLGFAEGAVVRHHQGATTGSGHEAGRRPRLPVFLDERNKMLLTRDLYPRLLPVAAVSALALLILRYGVKGRGGALGHAVSGWLAGLRNERGRPAFVAA